MAKELPYFRFTPQEWQNGDISLERYELKGLFTDVCAYYWVKDCSITKAMLEKKFSNAITMVKELLELGIIYQNKNDEFLCISFLDEQFDILSEKRKRRQIAGSKGGKKKSSNAKAMLKQCSSYKDKDKDKEKDKDKDKDNLNKNSDFDFSKLSKKEKQKYWESFLIHREKLLSTQQLESWSRDSGLQVHQVKLQVLDYFKDARAQEDIYRNFLDYKSHCYNTIKKNKLTLRKISNEYYQQHYQD